MSKNPKPFVFVLMPFTSDFDDTYKLAIKPACDRAGAYAERVDEQIFEGSILDRIYNQIAKADLIVSDLSGRNPNVFYETGYAHALGKPTLLLTKSSEDIPFDLKHYPHVIYGGSLATLTTEVEKRVSWYMQNPRSAEKAQTPLHIRVNGQSIDNDPVVKIEIPAHKTGVSLRIDINNPIERSIRFVSFEVGVITPSFFSRSNCRGETNVVNISKNENLHLIRNSVSILPGAWESLDLFIGTNNMEIPDNCTFPCVIRQFSEGPPRDWDFKLMISRPRG